jgi:hypothetical protein
VCFRGCHGTGSDHRDPGPRKRRPI